MTRKMPSTATAPSRNPAVVKRRILDAAETVFSLHGYSGASTNQILDEFGGSKATLFRHYPTKEEMLLAVVKRIAQDLTAARAGHSDPQEPMAWLSAFGESALRASLSPRAIFVGKLVVAEGAKMPVLEKTFTSIAIEPMLAPLTEHFALWHATGDIICPNPSDDALRFFDLLLSGWISRFMFGLGPELDEGFFSRQSQAAAELFLLGRRPRERHT